MANRRRGRSRGRSGGNLYARPISEPANFVEFDMTIPLTGPNPTVVTLAAVYAALTAAVPASRIQKYRVSSFVVDPLISTQVNWATDLEMGVSGNHYQSFQTNRPLRVRLGKGYMQDGMWVPCEGGSPNWPAPFTDTDPFLTIESTNIVSVSAELHLRVAYTDPM